MNNEFTSEQVMRFFEEHMAQKGETEVSETVESLDSKEDAYQLGIYEGLLNGIVLAGGKLTGDFNFEEAEE